MFIANQLCANLLGYDKCSACKSDKCEKYENGSVVAGFGSFDAVILAAVVSVCIVVAGVSALMCLLAWWGISPKL